MATERALIYIPAGEEHDRWLDPAYRYVERRGYQLVSVVRDWETAMRLLNQHDAEVLVVTLKDHPPADRVPRVEYVEEEGPPPTPRQQRPRRITRPDEEAAP